MSIGVAIQAIPEVTREPVRADKGYDPHLDCASDECMHSFNQATVSYDASKEEKVEALKRQQDAVANRLREK